MSRIRISILRSLENARIASRHFRDITRFHRAQIFLSNINCSRLFWHSKAQLCLFEGNSSIPRTYIIFFKGVWAICHLFRKVHFDRNCCPQRCAIDAMFYSVLKIFWVRESHKNIPPVIYLCICTHRIYLSY